MSHMESRHVTDKLIPADNRFRDTNYFHPWADWWLFLWLSGTQSECSCDLFCPTEQNRFHWQKAVLCRIRELHRMLLFSLSPCFQGGNSILRFANSSHCAFSMLFSVTRVLYTVSPEWSAVTLQASWCYTKEMVSLRKTNCCPSAFILTEEKRSVSAHLVILFIFRKGRLVSAKTGSEITDGPYRAGRAVVQPWGYHYSVAGCQGKASVLRSLSSDASHMYYDCEAEQQRGVIRLRLSPPGLIWMEFEPRLLCRPSRIQLLTSHSSGIS